MKINKIYISAFGGLKDFTLDLEDGFSVIYGENENGKSTVMAFIKAMFYGAKKKTQSLENSPRTKYMPLDNSECAGRIFFEDKGKRYCLERTFRNSDSTDKILLTDLDTGESENVQSNIGTEFFGIGEAAFERSMFIGTAPYSCKAEEAAGDINSKMSSIALTGDEDVSYKKVIDRITDAKEALVSKSGRTGSIVKSSAVLESLNERYDNSKRLALQKSEIHEVLDTLYKEKTELEKKRRDSKTILDKKDDVKNAAKLKDYINAKAELEKAQECLKNPDGSIIDDMFLSKANFCLSRYSMETEKVNGLTDEINDLETEIKLSSPERLKENEEEISKLDRAIADSEPKADALENALEKKKMLLEEAKRQFEIEENRKSKPCIPLLVSAIAITVICAFFVIFSKYALIGVTAGVVLFILCLIIRPKNSSAKLKAKSQVDELEKSLLDIKSDLSAIKSEISTKTVRLAMLNSSLNTSQALRQQKEETLNKKRDLLGAENEKLLSAKADLIKLNPLFENKTCEEISEFLASLKPKAEAVKQIKTELNLLSRDLGGISYEEAQLKLENSGKELQSNIDFDKADKEYSFLNEEIAQINSKITEKETELKTAFRNAENPEDVRKEIDLLSEELKEKNNYHSALILALKVMEESFNEARRSYGSKVDEKSLEIFSKLTNGKYTALSVSKGLNITTEKRDAFGTLEAGYLSQGTKDQAYLSMRLALSKLMSEDDSVPIMLDDALSQYDDKRCLSTLEFLKDYAKDSQAVLFTCHDSVCEMSKGLDIPVKPLHS